MINKGDILVCINVDKHKAITKGNHYKILNVQKSERFNSTIVCVKCDIGMDFWVSSELFTTINKYRKLILNNILE